MPILVCRSLFCPIWQFNFITVRKTGSVAYSFDFRSFSEGVSQFQSTKVGIHSGNEVGILLLTDILLLGALLIAILVLIGYVRWLRHTRRYNRILEGQLQLRTNKIMQEQKLLQEQNKIIAEKSNNLRASITYAKHIQNALLPSEESLREYFPHSFATIVSKEIVSGDFYWLTQKYDTSYLAVADCTGHGVPGAFMSLIGRSLLEDTINSKGVLTPGNILSDLRINMLKTLTSNGSAMSNDGMDITLCAYNQNNQVLCYAGANQSLYVVRKNDVPLMDINERPYAPLCSDNGFVLYELKADRQPIGNYYGPQKAYTNYTVKLQKTDRFYAFTDGFRDQFGGLRNKKLKCASFRSMLLNAQELNMPHQKEQLLNAFYEWKGTLEQNDDMCLVGIEV
jgi:serine phosphatase RsbU (regulator of sigma subunit)